MTLERIPVGNTRRPAGKRQPQNFLGLKSLAIKSLINEYVNHEFDAANSYTFLSVLNGNRNFVLYMVTLRVLCKNY